MKNPNAPMPTRTDTPRKSTGLHSKVRRRRVAPSIECFADFAREGERVALRKRLLPDNGIGVTAPRAISARITWIVTSQVPKHHASAACYKLWHRAREVGCAADGDAALGFNAEAKVGERVACRA